MKSCLVQATPVVEDLGAVHTGLLRPLHSICRDSAKKIRCRRYPDRSTAIHRADVVLFGLGLLYFPSAPAFCAGQKTAVYHVSCTENVCARALYSLWDCGGSVTVSVESIFFLCRIPTDTVQRIQQHRAKRSFYYTKHLIGCHIVIHFLYRANGWLTAAQISHAADCPPGCIF